MKKIIFYILFISIVSKGYSHTSVNVSERGNIAERIWVNKGLRSVLDNIKVELAMSESLYINFQKVYFNTLVDDKLFFFNTALSDSTFVLENIEGNHDAWLKQKKEFYTDKALYFIKHSDSLIKDYDHINTSTSITTGGCSPSTDCVNVDFENGDLSTWDAYDGAACSDGTFGNHSCHNFILAASPARISIQTGAGYDPTVGGSILPVVCPGSTYSVRLENTSNGAHASKIERVMTVGSGSPMYIYKYAVVLEDPGSSHTDAEKPFFRVRVLVLDSNCDYVSEVSCAKYVVIANSSNSELAQNFSRVSPTSNFYYKQWTSVGIPLEEYEGKNIKIEFIVSDCALGAHVGYAYLDGECLNSQVTIGSCIDDYREISVSEGFQKYWWSGPGIIGSNSGKMIKVIGSGMYTFIGTTTTKCKWEHEFEVDECPPSSDSICAISSISLTPSSCSNNEFTLSGTVNFSTVPSSGVLVISNGYLSQIYYAPYSSSYAFTINNLIADGASHTVTAKLYKGNFFSEDFIKCQASNTYTAPSSCYSPEIDCENCLTSFNPEPGKYIISAWVKEVGAASDIETYANPYIEIQFSGGTTTLPKIYASGKIIDKWQRVYFIFDIPIGATDISINLGTNSGSALFDDIRIHPANGGFVSYVYDPVSLKLVATLDDNNYATIYEYDNEGTLLRVKKETERGIMTIKESRENSPKR
ncbi:MAG: hypothetical protein V4613_09490 [Bacteroidota bacterium]